MPDNLVVFYSLRAGEPEADVAKAIRSLGEAIPVGPSLWYVASSWLAGEAAERIRTGMGAASALLVVNASTDSLAWFNLDYGDEIQQLWFEAD
jgi:hypothetical protein